MNNQPVQWPWWTIHGEELMNALRRAHGGDTPEIVYLELLANATTDDDTDRA